jgi:hypothetical protein
MAVQKIQGTAPQSKQQLLSNKLANIASSEDEEREKINALTRSGGLLGILQVLLSSYVFPGPRDPLFSPFLARTRAQDGSRGLEVINRMGVSRGCISSGRSGGCAVRRRRGRRRRFI